MASKKEHKRRQKARARGEKSESGKTPAPFRPGRELNSLNLLSKVDAPKNPQPEQAENAEQAGPDSDAEAAAALREMEERERERITSASVRRIREAEEERMRLERERENGEQAERERTIRQAEQAEQMCREAEAAERCRIEEEKRTAAEADRRNRAEAEKQAGIAGANSCDRALREAEEAEKRREEQAEQRLKEKRRLVAETAGQEAKEAAERERQVREAEAERIARREEEENERRRREAEDKARQEEEKRAAEAKAADQARRDAEERERERRRAEEQEREAAEHARRENEELERQARAAAEAELARQEAGEKEKQRLLEEQAAALQAARDAEEQTRAALVAEEKERLAREAEQARQAAEAEAKARREAEAENRRRQEEAAAERARQMAADAERARLVTEQVEKTRRDADEAGNRFREQLAAEKRRQDELAAERALEMAVAAENVRLMSEKVEQTRLELEERERQALQSGNAGGAGAGDSADAEASGPDIDALVAEATAGCGPSGPRLEVDNPYWEKSPEIFEMISGAPHAAPSGAFGTDGNREQIMPVSMEHDYEQMPRGEFSHGNESEGERTQRSATQPVPAEKRMYIVMITPEVAPCAKVGGLGDVILGLGRELMKRGHGVEVICPMYAGMRYDQIYDLHEEYGELWSPHFTEWRAEKVFQGKVEGGLQVNFITGGNYTERESIYGYEDDLQRFSYFSRQALEFMYKTNRRPDIIHCHDWATGLVPAILWDVYEKLGWNNTRAVYTIHNNECQGLCGFPEKLLSLVGLDFRKYLTPDKMQDDIHKNCINMMKAGIVFSNFVTTVSPTYAGELKSVGGGRGLQTTIAKNSAKVGGVLNGIDYDSWNPATDPKLAARYTVGEDFFKKYDNKKALREWLGLYDAWRPIVSVVTRLTHQKGLDLIKAAIFQTIGMQGQFVLLGSAPDPRVNADFLALQNQLKDNHDVSLYIGYHEDLSRLIYAGSDMFLIPSLYEPCGLTQMISLRYGTVPIVRETGGLVDTVFDLDNSGLGLNDANGFTFRDPNTTSVKYGLERAIRLWYDNPEAFNRLARNGMRYDYSWRGPAEHYENIYNYVKA